MSYGFPDDVLARTGRVSGYFTRAGSRPNLEDIQTFLDECSALVDEAIRSHGLDPAGLDQGAIAAFTDVVVAGAAARALGGMGDSSPQVQSILTEVDGIWKAAMGDPLSRQPDAIMGSVRRGDFPAIRALLAAGSPARAGALWEDEPDYGRPYERLSEWEQLRGTNLAPTFSRGQHL